MLYERFGGVANPLAFGTSATVCHYALMSTDVGFVGVQPDCLQLLLTQTRVKRPSLDSSKYVVVMVVSGMKFIKTKFQKEN